MYTKYNKLLKQYIRKQETADQLFRLWIVNYGLIEYKSYFINYPNKNNAKRDGKLCNVWFLEQVTELVWAGLERRKQQTTNPTYNNNKITYSGSFNFFLSVVRFFNAFLVIFFRFLCFFGNVFFFLLLSNGERWNDWRARRVFFFHFLFVNELERKTTNVI